MPMNAYSTTLPPRRFVGAPRADRRTTRPPRLGNTVRMEQQVFHLPRLENPPLRVDQRNAVTAELEPAREIAGIEHSITGWATGALTQRPRCRGGNISYVLKRLTKSQSRAGVVHFFH